jgi:N6-adenosine-specific RNA methylase IME4
MSGAEIASQPGAELVELAQARDTLERSRDLPQVKSIRDIATAAMRYAQAKKLGADAVKYAAEIVVLAECKYGELLAVTPKQPGPGRGKTLDSHPNVSSPRKQHGYELSKRSQKLATVNPEVRDEYLKSAQLPTPTGLLRLVKEQEREQARQENRALVDSTRPLELSPRTRYQTIAIDPPWDWSDEGDADQLGRARPTYQTMSLAQLAELPVGQQATDNAHLYLWITNRSLPKGFGLLEAWGFRYVTMLTWCKPHYGMGNYFRGQTEQVLFGIRGSLPLLRQDQGTWFAGDRPRGHSSKPEEFYKLVETCSPGPWLELFSRSERNGWVPWGAEAA